MSVIIGTSNDPDDMWVLNNVTYGWFADLVLQRYEHDRGVEYRIESSQWIHGLSLDSLFVEDPVLALEVAEALLTVAREIAAGEIVYEDPVGTPHPAVNERFVELVELLEVFVACKRDTPEARNATGRTATPPFDPRRFRGRRAVPSLGWNGHVRFQPAVFHAGAKRKLHEVLAELKRQYWTAFVLDGLRISDTASFFAAVAAAMPLHPRRPEVGSWDALYESILGGLSRHRARLVAVVWPYWYGAMAVQEEDHLRAITTLADACAYLRDPDRTGGRPTYVCVVTLDRP